jgi:uncharacterized protein involved in oxidation of intracellular sulfur
MLSCAGTSIAVEETVMSVLLVVNTAPYGSEGPYNALRLAEGLALRGEPVELFLMGDGVHTARSGQDPRTSHASVEQMLTELLSHGAECSCCGTCCAARGLTGGDLVDHVRLATIHDLAAAVARCDKVLSF